MLVFLDRERAREARDHAWKARESGASAIWESWLQNTKYLQSYACRTDAGLETTRCVTMLSRDFAPLSFDVTWFMRRNDLDERDKMFLARRWNVKAMFENQEWRKIEKYYRRWFNGGMIYHGPHDGFGNGSGPTFSVSLSPTNGWSIHT